ncbi:MAG: LCP family protein [Candidatus Riflebacteria bacterium]|nr:LCP family protein [Candidatus Riflebacteria bacterium]
MSSEKPVLAVSRRGAHIWAAVEILFFIFSLLFFAGVSEKWIALKIPAEIAPVRAISNLSGQSHFGKINILLLGLDSVEGTHRTDTIILTGLKTEPAEIHVLSVPRDTRVIIQETSRKINEIFGRFGVGTLQNLIEELLEIKIDRYIKIDFQGFINTINLLGGIDIVIETPMNYDDYCGKVHIHFASGPAHLDGAKALNYVRFRADGNADLGRIKRQQKFISAILEKVKRPGFIMQISGVVDQLMKNIDTNLTLPEILELIKVASTEKFTFKSHSLPGEARYIDKISYYIPFKEQSAALGATSFSDFSELKLSATFTYSPSLETSSPSSTAVASPASIQVDSSSSALSVSEPSTLSVLLQQPFSPSFSSQSSLSSSITSPSSDISDSASVTSSAISLTGSEISSFSASATVSASDSIIASGTH